MKLAVQVQLKKSLLKSQQPTANQLCENQKLITQEKGITPSWRGSSQILNNLHCKWQIQRKP